MKEKKKYFICLFVLACVCMRAQDLHLSQFYANPVYLNPAFTGANVCSRVVGTYRNQWPSIGKGYVSYLFSYDHSLSEVNSGIGLIVTNDVAGSGSLRTTSVLASYAYQITLAKSVGIRFGLQGGMGSKSINFNNLLFGDQIARGGNVATIETAPNHVTYFDSNAGLLVYTKKYWLGMSLFHLNKPNEALVGTDATLPMMLSIHGGSKFLLGNGDENPDEAKRVYFTPAFNYMHQRKFDQLDIGFYINWSVLNIGLWYRGIPVFKAYKPGYANNDAIAFLIGITKDKFNFGYSYDVTISKLAGNTNGAHEITISYQLCKPKKKKPKMVLPCPRF